MIKLLNRNFFTFFCAQFIASFGDSFNHITLIALIMSQIVKPGAAISMELFCYLLPSLILTPFIGMIIDKFSRKKIIILSSLYRFFVAGGFTFFILTNDFDNISITLIYLYSFLIGCGQSLFYPSKMAAVPQVVAPNLVRNANALVSGTGGINTTFGAIIAAVIITKIGIQNSLYSITTLYIISAILMSFVVISKEYISQNDETHNNIMCFINKHKKVRNALVLAFTLALLSAVIFAGISVYAADIYRIQVLGLSILKGMLGIGGILGISITLFLHKKLGVNRFLAFSFCGLALLLGSAEHCNSYFRAAFWLTAIGLLGIAMSITVDTILQKTTNRYVRGRTFALKAMLSTLATLSGTLFVSLSAGSISQLVIFKIVALICLGLAFIIGFMRKFQAKNKYHYTINKNMYDNFVDLMRERVHIFSKENALTIKNKDGYSSYTYAELTRKAKNFANYMIENNMINKGDRIALLCEARPEYSIVLFACIQSGGVFVPLDIKLTAPELINILSDCKPRILCISASYLEKGYYLKEQIPSIEKVFVVNDVKDEYHNTENIHHIKGDLTKHLARTRSLDETAYIVYTSATTGTPKGVMISFKNIYTQIRDIESVVDLNNRVSLVSILPLNHLLELNVGLMAALYICANITYTKSLTPREISNVLNDTHPTLMIIVPLFAKILKKSIEKEIRKNKTTEMLFNVMYKIAKFVPNLIRRIIFKDIINNLGGKLQYFVCGGAPLNPETEEFFDRIGVPVYQGYGLTETSPVVAVNYPKHNKKGSVGPALPSFTVKISECGEILVKGACVMQGYYNRPEKTAEAFDANGWFHTGDIGYMDKDGFLYITGRLKDVIVLDGGKKVFPEEIESVMEKSKLFKDLCVLPLKIKSGNKAGREQVGLIAVPNDELQNKTDEELQKIFSAEIKRLCSGNLAKYKIPTMVVIHRNALPKTTTMKVKRIELREWYKEKIKA